MQAGRELLLHMDNKCFNCLQEERDKIDLWDSWRRLFGKNKFDTQFNPSRSPQTKPEMNEWRKSSEMYLQMGIIWDGIGDLNEECEDSVI